MTLREVLGAAARDAPPVEISGLAYDNRAVEPGTLFFCVPGFTRDGHDFAPDAVARGAAALVVQRPLDAGVPEVLVGDVEHQVVRTTPEAIDLQRTFAAMLEAGDEACAMEISSHALELRRADGIHVSAAVFTNLTQDHLDFHPTMEDYFLAKRRLFASPLTDVRVADVDDP